MEEKVKILFAEDDINDAELIFNQIRKSGIIFDKMLVYEKEKFLDGLIKFVPDIIISDYFMPHFDGMSALNIRNEYAPLTPFIIVTGSVNEEVAVECLRSGADDYILKDNLTRLGSAITGSLSKYRLLREKKAAEEALSVANERLTSLFNVAPTGIGVVKDRILLEVNNMVCQMTGYSAEELTGKSARILYPDQKEFDYVGLEKYRQIIATGKGTVETLWKKKNGDIINVLLSSTYISQSDPDKGVIFTALDITDRKRYEDELIKSKEKAEESDRLKTAFLHNISHEIRTPLNAIVGFSSLLGEEDLDNETKNNYAEIIIQSSNHLLSVISDIVDIANIEANLIKINKEATNLNLLIRSVVKQFEIAAEKKNLILLTESNISDSDAEFIIDPVKLKQILSNLISNAIKFTDAGKIIITWKLTDNFIVFEVADTGIGIHEKEHEKIFGRFYQVDNSSKRLNEGTGLGLAISKGLVEKLGGKIGVSSEPGKGSRFIFTLPCEKPVTGKPESDIAELIESFSFPEKKKILVAEDMESNFKLIHYFLKNTNAEIIRAENGKEAVNKFLSAEKIDLILMDIKMPVMDGYTAVKLIREKDKSVPIIAQTAYLDDKETAIKSGCSGFLLKPFDKRSLIKTISEFI